MNEPLDPLLTHEEVDVAGHDMRGYTLIVPLDAPIPSEVASAPMPTGSLYARLAPLAVSPEGSEFAFAPLSGSELLALERAWRLVATVPKIAVLMDLPGARYDVLFTQAARQIGIMRIDWSQVADGLAARLVNKQRLKDTQPWALQQSIAPVEEDRLPRSMKAVVRVPEPTSEADDEN